MCAFCKTVFDSVVVNDFRLKDEDEDNKSSFEDKDEVLKIGPRGFSRTRTFLEDNNTASHTNIGFVKSDKYESRMTK